MLKHDLFKKKSVLNSSYIVLLFHFYLQIQMITEINITPQKEVKTKIALAS